MLNKQLIEVQLILQMVPLSSIPEALFLHGQREKLLAHKLEVINSSKISPLIK